MPIIRNKKGKNNSLLKAKLNPLVLEQIEHYCQWAGIYDLGYFVEKAANELFLKDKDWNLYQEQNETKENQIESL